MRIWMRASLAQPQRQFQSQVRTDSRTRVLNFSLALAFVLMAALSLSALAAPIDPNSSGTLWIRSAAELFRATSPLQPACMDQKEKLENAIWHYWHTQRDYFTLSMRDSTYFGRYASEIHSLLMEAERTECFQSLAVNYALSSFYNASLEPGSPSLAELSLLLLARQERLVPISKKLREEKGGLWAKVKLSSRRHLLLGAHDCQTSIIYFDPYLSSHDLAASLRHELSHLLRDKLLPAWPELTAKESLLVDETLASINGAIAQAAISVMKEQTKIRNSEVYGQHSRLGDDEKNKLAVQVESSLANIDFDLTMYGRQGHLLSIVKRLKINHLTTMSDFYARVFADPELVSHFESIVTLVGQIYFPNEKFDTRKIVRVLQSQPPKSFDTFTWSPTSLEELSTLKEPLVQRSQLHRLWDFETSNGLLRPFVQKSLRELSATLAHPSPACLEFLERKKDGTLDDYLGHDADIRPGGEGVKPGGEGVKPGGEGVKPGTGTKPCLRPPKGF